MRPDPPQLPLWPVTWWLSLVPLWWVLGLFGVSHLLAASVMAFLLSTRVGRCSFGPASRALLPWWCLVGLVLVSATAMITDEGGFRLRPVYLHRLADVLAAAIIAGYLAAALHSHRGRKASGTARRRVLVALARCWCAVVALGCLVFVAPEAHLVTVSAHLVPDAASLHPLLADQVLPPLAEVQVPDGVTVLHRTAAPFAYANSWGQAYVLLTPAVFAHLAAGRRRGRCSRAAWCLALAASLIPAAASSNRVMVMALLVSVVVGLVLTCPQRGRRLGAVAGVAAAGVVAVVLLRASDTRTGISSSGKDRASLIASTLEHVARRPWTGHAAPDPDLTTGIPLGTQGMVWNLLYCFGVPALVCFVWFIARVLAVGVADQVRRASNSRPDPQGAWLSAGLAGLPVTIWFYSLGSVQLVLVLIIAVTMLSPPADETVVFSVGRTAWQNGSRTVRGPLRRGVMAARRPLESCSLGSNPSGGTPARTASSSKTGR